MKHAWRNGTAPTCTAEVPNFVEKHVHDNYILTAGVKSLPVHRHLLHVDKPTVLRKPPHTVHKVLKDGGATSMSSSQTTTRRAKDRISSHPYKHAAAAIASARRTTDDPSLDDGGGGDEKTISSSSSIPSLFGVAGVIGGPEFDPYQKYRHDIFPFKEQLAHEVNKLVLEKKNLDALRQRVAAATTRNLHDESTDEESSYGDGGETTDMLEEDDDNDDESMLSSSSALVDDDDGDDDDDDEDIDELL